jgi:hypothetical protein
MLSMLLPGWRSTQARGLFEWSRRYVRPRMTVWDVGANQGLFTFAASAMAGFEGRVFAFEPDPFLTYLMDRSLSTGTHKGAAITVLPVAVSDPIGFDTFCIA